MDDATSIAYPWDPVTDVVVFETPEQTQVEFRVAPFGTRLVAALLDNLIVFLITFALMIVALVAGAALGALTGSSTHAMAFVGVLYAAWSFLGVFYFVWGEVRGEGQTFGKRFMKIRTVMTTGQGITLGAALIRNFARLVDNIPVFWLIPTLGEGRRRLGDILGGTYVVQTAEKRRRKNPIEWPAVSYQALEEKEFYFGGELAQKLYPDDLNLVEYLLERVQAAPPRRRKQLLQAVARRYVDRLGWEEEREHVLAETLRFFEELGLFLKARFEGQAF